MSGELQVDFATGRTVYFLIRNSTGSVWNGSAFETYVTANLGNYDIAATEQGTASGYYAGNMPALSLGVYYILAKERVGGSPAETDPTIGSGTVQWNGAEAGYNLIQSGLTKNKAFSDFTFLMVDATDFATPETGLTVTARRSIDGGAFALCANAVAEVGNGIYQIDLAASDLNGDNTVTLRFSATGAADRFITIRLTP